VNDWIHYPVNRWMRWGKGAMVEGGGLLCNPHAMPTMTFMSYQLPIEGYRGKITLVGVGSPFWVGIEGALTVHCVV